MSLIGEFSATYKSADESQTNNTTLADDSHLVINNVDSSTRQHFTYHLFVNNAGVGGFKCGLSGSVGVNVLKAHIAIYDDTGTNLVEFKRISMFGEAAQASLAVGDSYVVIEGTLETTTNGSLKLQWAQKTSSGSATTVQRGSRMEVYQN